jgi:hypothetical protein
VTGQRRTLNTYSTRSELNAYQSKSAALPPKLALENTPGRSSPRLSLGERLAARAGVRLDGKLTEEERARPAKLLQAQQVRLAELQSKIKIANEIFPKLRLQMPSFYIPLDIETCYKHYGKYQLMRFDKDAANKIAGLLTSFQREHPWEWEYSGWKNDAMAELMLGRLNIQARINKGTFREEHDILPVGGVPCFPE